MNKWSLCLWATIYALLRVDFMLWTIKSDHERWQFLMVQLSLFDFLKYQFTKLLGPSLGVNQM